MSKKKFGKLFGFIGIAFLVVPLIVLVFFPISLGDAIRLMHVPLPEGFDDQWWLYISALFLCLAGLLQFPFKEEEGWTCDCGYDLSYVDTKSKKCPECGVPMQVEWTAIPGEYSRQTKRRLKYALILFLFATMLVLIGAWIDLTVGSARI